MDSRPMCPHHHRTSMPSTVGASRKRRGMKMKLICLLVSQIIRDTNGIMLNLSVYEQIYNLIII